MFDLNAEGRHRLITNLLGVLTGGAEASREADDLFARITSNPHLADLAGNPLLCTTLVLVFKYRGRMLPERRADVCANSHFVLGRWEEENRLTPKNWRAWAPRHGRPSRPSNFGGGH